MPSGLRSPRFSPGRINGFGRAQAHASSARRWLGLWGLVALIGLSGCNQELVAIRPAEGTGGAGSCAYTPCSMSDSRANQCCEGTRCAYNLCVPLDAGACGYYGQDCENDNSCCNLSPCEAVNQGRAHACVNPWCTREGWPCQLPFECCSLSCENGICTQGRPCGVHNDKCNSNSDCCSNECTNGSCDSSTSCAMIGDTCSSSKDCCSGSCVNLPGGSRCMVNNNCRNLGEICTITSTGDISNQCCSTTCVNSRCAASKACAQLSDSCLKSEDCCSSYCDFGAAGQSPGTCACVKTGQACTKDANCCFNLCKDDGSGQLKCN